MTANLLSGLPPSPQADELFETLLAQGDSCIGSKTSINLGDKKNLIGNFYPPDSIFIDPGFLETLAVEERKGSAAAVVRSTSGGSVDLF
ncbi:MAG: hypothetical protein HGA47_00060 [Zoogloea sp.]|nr:hypothetical protein [Zoogloea sp.]